MCKRFAFKRQDEWVQKFLQNKPLFFSCLAYEGEFNFFKKKNLFWKHRDIGQWNLSIVFSYDYYLEEPVEGCD